MESEGDERLKESVVAFYVPLGPTTSIAVWVSSSPFVESKKEVHVIGCTPLKVWTEKET